MAILSVIRRWHLRDGVSIREIARRTRLSRNTIRKYLASAVVEPRYPKRQSPSKLDGFAAKLTAWLKAETRKGRKQRRNLRQMHADLVALGFTGSYDRVAAFARSWRQAQQELARTAGRGTFVPLTFAPGEAFQFDWSEDWAVIAGERTKLQVAQFKLSHSRAFFLRAYPLQTHEMLFDAHPHAFARSGWHSPPRHLRQHEDRRRPGPGRQGARRQRALCGDGEPLPVRGRVLQSGRGLGEGADREERPGYPAPAVARRTGVWPVWRRSMPGCRNACVALWQTTAHPEQADAPWPQCGRRSNRS